MNLYKVEIRQPRKGKRAVMDTYIVQAQGWQDAIEAAFKYHRRICAEALSASPTLHSCDKTPDNVYRIASYVIS